MKKKYLFIALALIWVFVVWRYVVVNEYYNQEYPEYPEEIFSQGEEVAIYANPIDGNTNIDGYSIQVDQLEIITQEELKRRWPEYQLIDKMARDKFALVSVTLGNSFSDGGIMLTDMLLHTQDTPLTMNWELLLMANPILAGNYGIILPHEAQCQLVLPFTLNASLFRSASWKNLNQCQFYLRVNEPEMVKTIHIMCK